MRLIASPLTPEAYAALAPIMHCGMRLDNRLLYRVEGEKCQGWLIIQIFDDFLFIVAFAGRGAIPLLRQMREGAKNLGLKRVVWLSFHRKVPRALREFFVTVESTDIPGEYRYSFITGA